MHDKSGVWALLHYWVLLPNTDCKMDRTIMLLVSKFISSNKRVNSLTINYRSPLKVDKRVVQSFTLILYNTFIFTVIFIYFGHPLRIFTRPIVHVINIIEIEWVSVLDIFVILPKKAHNSPSTIPILASINKNQNVNNVSF